MAMLARLPRPAIQVIVSYLPFNDRLRLIGQIESDVWDLALIPPVLILHHTVGMENYNLAVKALQLAVERKPKSHKEDTSGFLRRSGSHLLTHVPFATTN